MLNASKLPSLGTKWFLTMLFITLLVSTGCKDQEAIELKDKEISSLKQANLELAGEIQKLQDDIKKLAKDRDEFNGKLASIRKEFEERSKEATIGNNPNGDSQSKDSKLEKLVERNSLLSRERDDLRSANKAIEKRLGETKSLEANVEELKNKVKVANDIIADERKQNLAITIEMDDLKDAHEKTIKDIKEEFKDPKFEEMIVQLNASKEKNQSLRKELQASKSSLDSRDAEILTRNKKIQALQIDLDGLAAKAVVQSLDELNSAGNGVIKIAYREGKLDFARRASWAVGLAAKVVDKKEGICWRSGLAI